MKRGGLAIALVVVLTGALRFFSPSSAPSTDETATSHSAAKSPSKASGGKPVSVPKNLSHGSPAEGIEAALFNYFGLNLKETVAIQDAASPHGVAARLLTPPEQKHLFDLYSHWLVPSEERSHTRFAIAILPDPAHTQLNLYFDRGVESIEQAAQESGYYFDRATMPWDLTEHTESPDFQKRDEEAAAKTLREAFPGLLVFRHGPQLASGAAKEDDSTPHTLLVFLVGEAPTGGIRKDQFARAIQIMTDVQSGAALSPTSASRKLLILGPTFSGTLNSLAEALRLDAEGLRDHKIFVFSGTVRGTQARCSFASSLPKDALFIPFQDNETHLLDQFLTFAVTKKLYSMPEIAVLSEDETQYGTAPKPDDPMRVASEPTPQCSAITVSEGQNNRHDCDKELSSSCLHYIQFPRGISQFRSAYARQVGSASSQRTVGQGKPVLPLDLEATGNEDDSVASFAKIQFPLSQEAVMLGIITRLHQSHPRLILLRSSDPVDQLFLARYLRQNYPEARIVIISPDLLFSREDDGLLHGVLGLSCYPLVPDVEPFLTRVDPNDKPRSERSFPSTNDLGTYNAFAALLSAQEQENFPQDVKSPATPHFLPRAPYVAYGSFVNWRNPQSQEQRHLWPDDWVTILGHDGYWPLDVISNDSKTGLHPIAGFPYRPNEEDFTNKNSMMQRHTARPWTFAYVLVLLLLCFHCLSIRFGSIFSGQESIALFGAAETPADPADELDAKWKGKNRRNRRRRSILVAIGTFSLFLVLEAMVGVRFAAVLSSEGRGWTFLLSALPFLLVLFVGWHVGFHRGSKLVAGILVAAAFLVALLVNLDCAGPAAWMSSLTAYRAVHLTSGVSPLLPFLFLFGAGYCVMWFELQGLAVTDCRRPRLPDRDDIPKTFYRVSEEESRELHHISIPLTVPWRILGKAILCLVPLLVLTYSRDHRPVLTMEGLAYDRWYALFLFLTLTLFIGCLLRLTAIWSEAKRLLGGLDNLPLRDAFRRLQDFSWSLLWSPSGSAIRDSYKLVSRELECIKRLKLALDQPERSGSGAIPSESVKNMKTALDSADIALGRINEIYPAAVGARDTKHPLLLRIDDVSSTGLLVLRFATLQKVLAKIAGVLIKEALEKSWNEDLSPVASSTPRDATSKKTPFQRIAEEYVSMVYANFLTSTLLRMRTLVCEAISVYLFLLLSISFYPFEPNPAMFTLAVVLVGVMALIIGAVYSQMHKDAALSRLTSTAEGELGIDFWLQFVGAGAVPVLSLLAVQFPAVSRIVTGLLEPALQSVK